MKTTFKFPLLFILVVALAFTACEKEEEEPVIPQNDPTPTTQSAPPTPTIEGADASLWAIRSASTQTVGGFTVDVNIGLAVAAFAEGANFETLVDVGTVEVDGTMLTKQANNAYTFTPSQTDPTGLDFDNNVTWEITGGSGFQQFNTAMNITFPTVSEITSGSTVSKSAGYTLTVNEVTYSDSVLFMIGDVIKYIPGNGESCTFTSAELSGLSNGASVATVAGISATPTLSNGKTIYHGRETVRTISVTIED